MHILEKRCPLLIAGGSADAGGADGADAAALKKDLESPDVAVKLRAMKAVILASLNGGTPPNVLMTVIRFVMPVDDHDIKRILLLYWETVEKTDAQGKLLPEMILVCNNLRNDLIHPNEYVRGITLRFLWKLKEPELLEPLLPSVRTNLTHRNSYVRKNAVLTVFNIYKNFENLIPDGPEVIEAFLEGEGDYACKRNAFLMLYHCAQDRAVAYMRDHLDQVAQSGETLQMLMLELIRKVCRQNPAEKGKYMKTLMVLLNSQSAAVQYEGAATLTSLFQAPSAIKSAAMTYVELLVQQSDNNVKMIVLDRISDLMKAGQAPVLQDLVMDILRALASHNMDIRKKTLDLVLELVSPRNIDEVMQVLKKEVLKTQNVSDDKSGEYRQLLVKTIHGCAVKFPDVAGSVVHLLMDFLGDANASSAHEVAIFVREITENYPHLRSSIISKLSDSFPFIRSARVMRTSLWILSEYCDADAAAVQLAIETIKAALGDIPFLVVAAGDEDDEAAEQDSSKTKPAQVAKNTILADGTYATQTVETNVAASAVAGVSSSDSTLRKALFEGDFFLGSCAASALARLALKLRQYAPGVESNREVVLVLEILVSMIRLGQSEVTSGKMGADAYERICQCIRVLTDDDCPFVDLFRDEWRAAHPDFVAEQEETRKELEKAKRGDKGKVAVVQADDLIAVRQLRDRSNQELMDLADDADADLSRATGPAGGDGEPDFAHRLKNVTQLTGLSDPIYAEAYVTVHQYDIVLEVLLANQTEDTLQNVTVEFATVGDLKLCERPQAVALGPHDFTTIRASIKVSSTESGVIFGNVLYDVGSSKQVVNLNEIDIDILDYIQPASCTDAQFRAMWGEFEWENKVAVNTQIEDIHEYMQHIIRNTNMRCLNSDLDLGGDCEVLSANLYARSCFGEDALLNMSIEKQADGKIGGVLKIRAKTQGIALSIGDNVTLKQKGPQK